MPTGLATDQIRDQAIVDVHINNTAAIKESKLSYDVSTGHNHNGINSRAISGGGSGGVDVVIDAVFTGFIDGINDTYTMPSNFKVNTLQVYYQGIRQKRTAHFTELLPNRVRLGFIPKLNSTLIFDYVIA